MVIIANSGQPATLRQLVATSRHFAATQQFGRYWWIVLQKSKVVGVTDFGRPAGVLGRCWALDVGSVVVEVVAVAAWLVSTPDCPWADHDGRLGSDKTLAV
jgi:hypothetical protein